MIHSSLASKLEDAVIHSFLGEVNSLKPGNVSPYSEGHNMTVADFIKSAELSSPILCDASLSVGERILKSVKVTISEVGCNTNLGMLLLFAPLIRAAELGVSSLRSNVKLVLQESEEKDATHIFDAIRHANPGGLGASTKYDVQQKNTANISLRVAMAEAKDRDLIAKQYVTNFADIFSYGFISIKDFAVRWNSVQWATVACYMGFMAGFPDSHIRRKFCLEVAEEVKASATPIATAFREKDRPEEAMEMLMKFDKTLKQKGINPGSCADLTAASLLVYHLGFII